MDTHDVSEVREYWQYLHQQKQTLKDAQSRKGQRLKMTKSRDEIIMQFMFRRMMASTAPLDSKTIRSSFVPPAYAPCTAPLRILKKVVIKDLTLETHHRGSYILLRAVTPDHLPDVRFIPDHDTLIPSSWRRQLMENDASANYWKLKGNNCFNKANYHVAVDW
jgi:hypothetical protein